MFYDSIKYNKIFRNKLIKGGKWPGHWKLYDTDEKNEKDTNKF